MNPDKEKKGVELAPNEPVEAQPKVVDMSPTGLGHRHFDFHQTSMDLQKSNIEIKLSLDALIKTVDGIKTDVKDLVRWKHMILGAAVVIGSLITIIGIGYKVFKDDYSLVPKSEITQSSTVITTETTKSTEPATEETQEKSSKPTKKKR